ncbi:uncharacterized protein LOC133798211 [Humulus lupulus]|uniref:uncharacterized protein LOC133798211 n=1 Tax=Humulus lupulus TaxID=3486 RepID=UPI002B4088FF|nr:uncharacterized protein LOC133798211 [Humulus lupulus]
MEAERRRARVRKALSDCSNTNANANATTPSSQSSSLRLKPQKHLLSSSIKKFLTNNDGKSANSTDVSQNVSLLPPSVASPLLRTPMLSSASDRGNSEALEPCSVNTRRQTIEKRKRKRPPTEVEDVIIAEKRRNRGKENVDPNTCTPATKKIDVTQSTVQKENISKSENLFPPPIASEALEPCSVNSRRQITEKRKSEIPPTEELSEDVIIAEKRRNKGKEKVDPNPCTPATKKIDFTQSTVQKVNISESEYLLPPPIVCEALEPCSVNSGRQITEIRKSEIPPTEELFEDVIIAEKRRNKGKEKVDPNPCTPATKKIDVTQSTAQKENTLESVYLLPPPIVSSPSQPRSLSVSGRHGFEPFEPCYSRRRTAEKRKSTTEASDGLLKDTLIAHKRTSKRKAIAEPVSCPATKIRKIGENVKEAGGNNLSKANTVPTKKGQKDAAKHALSQEFIEQQRANFAEIDAFELPEASDELLNDTLIGHKRKSKGKAIAEPVSCPPATKNQKTGENIKETGGDSLSKENTDPTKKGAKHALSQEFIEQQRAYFAEIDAFELPEEEVDSISE